MRLHLAAARVELDDPAAPDARPLGVMLVDPDRVDPPRARRAAS